MTDTSGNPHGAGYFNAIDNGAVRQQFVIDPAVETPLPFGTVVQIEDYAGPGSTNPPVVPLIQPSSTTSDDLVIGILTDGLDYRGTRAVDPGAVALVTALGVCQVLCDATTVAGEALIQSPSNAGCARTAADPSGRTFGVCLQSKTISSGTSLVWAAISPGAFGGGGAGGITELTSTGDSITITDPTGPTTNIEVASGGGSAGELLATQVYAPAEQVGHNCTVGSLAAVDETNLTLEFVVPASGNVDVEVELAYQCANGSTFEQISLALFEHGGSTQVGNSHLVSFNETATTTYGGVISTVFCLTGLTPGSYQVDLAAGRIGATGGSGYLLFLGTQGVIGGSGQGSEAIMRAFSA